MICVCGCVPNERSAVEIGPWPGGDGNYGRLADGRRGGVFRDKREGMCSLESSKTSVT